jgi:hypothetical protein
MALELLLGDGWALALPAGGWLLWGMSSGWDGTWRKVVPRELVGPWFQRRLVMWLLISMDVVRQDASLLASTKLPTVA